MTYHYGEWARRDYIVGCIYFCLNDYRTHMGEDGAGKFKARIHGITDLYLRKKPSYFVFKQLASPVQINNVKKINDSAISITLLNKNSLPSYTLRGYGIRWRSATGKVLEKAIPVLEPGQSITLQIDDIEQRFSFDVVTGNGVNVISYPFVH
jgi:beta-glucuronidase